MSSPGKGVEITVEPTKVEDIPLPEPEKTPEPIREPVPEKVPEKV